MKGRLSPSDMKYPQVDEGWNVPGIVFMNVLFKSNTFISIKHKFQMKPGALLFCPILPIVTIV